MCRPCPGRVLWVEVLALPHPSHQTENDIWSLLPERRTLQVPVHSTCPHSCRNGVLLFPEVCGDIICNYELAGESTQPIAKTLRPVWGLMDKCYPVTTQRRKLKSGKKQVSRLRKTPLERPAMAPFLRECDWTQGYPAHGASSRSRGLQGHGRTE